MTKLPVLRNILFQIHWFGGITAGIVLAVVGVSGALLSFEHEIQDWLNADVRGVAPAGERLLPDALLARIEAQHPGRRVQSLQFENDVTHAARVTFAPRPAPDGRANAGRPRGEARYVNPYSGEVNAAPGNRGETFFRRVMQLHRWLTWGELGNQAVGKQLVGASTLLCVYFAFSGLYLRWPGLRAQWRVWLKPNFRLRGRPFLWNLHAVIGTWVLVFYVLMSLTGLQWSYDWYRKGLYTLAGVPMPNRAQQQEGAAARRNPGQRPSLDGAWETFSAQTQTVGYRNVTINLPRSASDPVELRYLPEAAAHERATNSMKIEPTSGTLLQHERYVDKSFGGKLVSSIFPLHSGSFFGVGGVVLYMLAALAMPVFTVTGWMLYLRRRRSKAAARANTTQLAPADVPADAS